MQTNLQTKNLKNPNIKQNFILEALKSDLKPSILTPNSTQIPVQTVESIKSTSTIAFRTHKIPCNRLQDRQNQIPIHQYTSKTISAVGSPQNQI